MREESAGKKAQPRKFALAIKIFLQIAGLLLYDKSINR